MAIDMNTDIFDVLCAVLDYEKFIRSDNYVTKRFLPSEFDVYNMTLKYYWSLPLPEGMNKNKADFERILQYRHWDRFDEIYNTPIEEMHKFPWK